jgi:hypothetical protein
MASLSVPVRGSIATASITTASTVGALTGDSEAVADSVEADSVTDLAQAAFKAVAQARFEAGTEAAFVAAIASLEAAVDSTVGVADFAVPAVTAAVTGDLQLTQA